ncbi:response regulator [Kribbella amoyensis]|uniref:hybrid sensor histidine kinase/response regulator n=1 Tax=Kribbella amoyensis TaxID=996641 RepID=UPI001478C485|nr:response regulator [Kribbella amoyensis]
MGVRIDPHDKIDALTGAVEDLAGQFTLQPLLRRILTRAISLLGGGAGSICSVDEQAGVYRKEADLGVSCQEGRSFPLDEGVTGAVVANRAPMVFDSYAEVRGGHVAPGERDRLHATVGVPIEWAGRIIGVCVVFSTDPALRFRDEDVRLLGLFAKHAAIAITNARLHADADDRTRRLAVSAERERVVRDVHDAVARALGSILMHIDAVDGALDPATAAHLAAARTTAGNALAETRRTVLGLGPALLEPHSLDDALAMELGWARSTTGIRTDLVVTGEWPHPAPELGQQALRIVQEALTNVVLHAQASLVRVGVLYGTEDLTIVVEDNGCGFDPARLATGPRTGLGLTGIVARAKHLGADLQIESTPGWGTRVRAHVPYERTAIGGRSGEDSWRILVVHPRPIVRAGLVRLLARAEPEIQVVGEIGEARAVVDAVRVLEPDVVLLDLQMPELDGARLTSYIRAARPGTSILVLADDTADDLLRAAVMAGARGCVGSAADGPALARAVLAAARGDVALTEQVLHRFVGARAESLDEALTEREHEVRRLVERGLPDKRIASLLGISVKTVEKHVGSVLRKTGSANRTALAHRSAVQRATPR